MRRLEATGEARRNLSERRISGAGASEQVQECLEMFNYCAAMLFIIGAFEVATYLLKHFI